MAAPSDTGPLKWWQRPSPVLPESTSLQCWSDSFCRQWASFCSTRHCGRSVMSPDLYISELPPSDSLSIGSFVLEWAMVGSVRFVWLSSVGNRVHRSFWGSSLLDHLCQNGSFLDPISLLRRAMSEFQLRYPSNWTWFWLRLCTR